MDNIEYFKDEYRFLSNFYPAPVLYKGTQYQSSEHAYQAAKASSVEEHDYVADAPTVAEAKKRGREITVRADFDLHKVEIMYNIVKEKFLQNAHLADKLKATGDAELIEGNWWNDRFWGECPIGIGHNNLGKILMRVRSEL